MRKIKGQYIKWLAIYTKPFLPRIFLLLAFNLVGSMIGLGMVLLSKTVIDTATAGGKFAWAVIIYVVISIGNQMLDVSINLISLILNEKFSFGIRKQLFEKIISSHWLDVERYHTGDLMTRLTSDAGIVAEGVIYVIPNIMELGVELIIAFITLYYFEPRLAIFAVILAPVATLSSIWMGKKLKSIYTKLQESEAAYRSFLQESLSNLLIVKSFNNEEYVTKRLVELRDQRFNWVYRKNKISLISSTMMSLTFNIGYIVAFAVGAYQISKKIITYGTMSVFLTMVNRIQYPIINLAQNIPKIVAILASVGRIIELQNIPTEVRAKEHIKPENMGVILDNITFGYVKEPILENASLSIRPGEMAAIIGESGIGKTTLVRLIMSFMRDAEGQIQFKNIWGEKEIANPGTRDYIAYVPQGNTLFSGTIKENIRMGRLDADDGEIIAALKMAAAYDFVMALPNGIDTVIGERGYGLSEGQAQRIAIARALVRKAPVLILDEATSALDENTELDVLKGIVQLEPKPTCLLITHRKAVLPYCDRKILIKNKKIYGEAI